VDLFTYSARFQFPDRNRKKPSNDIIGGFFSKTRKRRQPEGIELIQPNVSGRMTKTPVRLTNLFVSQEPCSVKPRAVSVIIFSPGLLSTPILEKKYEERIKILIQRGARGKPIWNDECNQWSQ